MILAPAKSARRKGQRRITPPLPMYEPISLKHVPTIVRRRDDRDLDKKFDVTPTNTQGLSSQDVNPFSNTDDFTNNEADEYETQANYDDEQDTQTTYTDEFGYINYYGASTSMYSEDSKSESEGVQDASDLVCIMDANVKDKIENDDGHHVKYGNRQDDCRYDDDDEAIDANALANYMVPSAKNEVHDNEKGDGKIIDDDRVKDDSHANFNYDEHDTQTYTYEFGYEDFGQISASMYLNDIIKIEGAKDVAIIDVNMEDKIKGHGHVEINHDQDISLENEVQDDEQGMDKICEDFNELMKVEDEAFIGVNFGKDDIEDDWHVHVKNDNDQGYKDEGDGAIDANDLTKYVDASVKYEVKDNEQVMDTICICSNDSKSESGGAEDTNLTVFMDAIDDQIIENDEYAEIDNCQDIKEDDDGAIDVNNLQNQVDVSIKNEVQDNEQGLCLEVSKNHGEEAKDEDLAINYGDDSIIMEVHDEELVNFDNKQDLQVEDSKSEGNEIKDEIVAKDEVLKIEHGSFDNVQGMNVDLQVEDSKSEGNGIKDAIVDIDDVMEIEQGNFDIVQGSDLKISKNHDVEVEDEDLTSYEDNSSKMKVHDKEHVNSDNEQDFSPDAFKETPKRDGYDLCCPKCKKFITHSMIFRRRVDDYQHHTTCYSFLFAIFCCNRW